MASASIFLSLSASCSLSMYCLWFSCLGDSTHKAVCTKQGLRLINYLPLTSYLHSISHRCYVASLSIFYYYFHADCFSELANCMPSSLLLPRCTRLSTSSYPYSVHLSNTRFNQYLHYFMPYTRKLWNSLPVSTFSLPNDLNSFKRGVSRQL